MLPEKKSKVALGALENLLDDITLSDIVVNGTDPIYIERNGVMEKTEYRFESRDELVDLIFAMAKELGGVTLEELDRHKMADLVLWDGSRMNVVLPPVAGNGPHISIRKFNYYRLTFSDLISYRTATPEIFYFLSLMVKARKNCIIAGGTGSGKTTLMNVLSSYIPDYERVVVIEDFPELQLDQPDVARLQTLNTHTGTNITIRELLINALHMRPDRIIVGESRGREAIDLLQAMNTGHDGSLTTIHANTPRDTLYRMETMCLMANIGLPHTAIRKQIASAIDFVVFVTRLPDGQRKITQISEITGMEGDVINMADVFVFKIETKDSITGAVRGDVLPTGYVPSFVNQMKETGEKIDFSIFKSNSNATVNTKTNTNTW